MHDDTPTADDAARLLLRRYNRTGRLTLDEAARALAEEFEGRFLVRGPCGPQPTPAVFEAFDRLTGPDIIYAPEDQLFRLRFSFEKE